MRFFYNIPFAVLAFLFSLTSGGAMASYVEYSGNSDQLLVASSSEKENHPLYWHELLEEIVEEVDEDSHTISYELGSGLVDSVIPRLNSDFFYLLSQTGSAAQSIAHTPVFSRFIRFGNLRN